MLRRFCRNCLFYGKGRGKCPDCGHVLSDDPAGALVTVNDVEQGRSPVTFPFTWYGDYRVLIESPEYQTLETHRRADAPIYQWPGLDFISEVLLPIKFHDHHDWHFTLAPRAPVDTEKLIDRAEDLRRQAQTPAGR